MCIIAAKPAGVKMPSDDILNNMWTRNSDGAGIMYPLNGKVRIEKGFMTYAAFKARIDSLGKKYNLAKMPLVMHFRITTHGGTKPENCHPFPITDSVGMLKKLKCDTPLGIAHNGIINIVPQKDISDTMEYIASQLAPLYKAVPTFYKNKHLMQMVSNAIDSKMVFLLPSGKIYTIGDFVEEGGIMYSNRSFERMTSFRDFKSYYWDDDWCLPESTMSDYEYRTVMWLDEAEGDFIVNGKGEMWTGDFAIDRNDKVYEYDNSTDALLHCPQAIAYNSEGMTLHFNENDKFTTQEIILKNW